jgi:hypothetical protein
LTIGSEVRGGVTVETIGTLNYGYRINYTITLPELL